MRVTLLIPTGYTTSPTAYQRVWDGVSDYVWKTAESNSHEFKDSHGKLVRLHAGKNSVIIED